MRFEVPQFIDVEDKIFGPLTFRQFAYLVGGAGLCYIAYKMLPIYIAFVIILPLAAFSVALAFVKVNEKPFIDTVEAAFNYFMRGKLYLWKKDTTQKKIEPTQLAEKKEAVFIPTLSESKLHDISWGLDVLNKRPE